MNTSPLRTLTVHDGDEIKHLAFIAGTLAFLPLLPLALGAPTLALAAVAAIAGFAVAFLLALIVTVATTDNAPDYMR